MPTTIEQQTILKLKCMLDAECYICFSCDRNDVDIIKFTYLNWLKKTAK